MSRETQIKLLGRIEPEDIISVLHKNCKKLNLKHDISSMKYVISCLNDLEGGYIKYGKESPQTWAGFIYDYDKDFQVYYYYRNVNHYENLDYYLEYGLKDMVLSETTALIMNYSDKYIEIGQILCKEFGGWIDEDDSDNEQFYYIERNKNSPAKIRHVTMEEVYEQFGEIVIIDK